MRAAILLAGALCFAAVDARAAEPLPFEGVYETTVDNWKLPGEIDDVAGSQIVRLEKTCTDWVLVAQFRLVATAPGGRSVDFDSDLAGTESRDGTRYRFRSETRLGGQAIASLAGQASRGAPGQAGRVQLTEPDARTAPLPRDTLFPVSSFVWTAQEWERGQKSASYVLFDGTTREPVRVFELLTGLPGKPNPLPDGDRALMDAKAWRTTGSFHSYGGNESSEPLTTLTQTVLANGIATELSLDIGIADVTLRLRRIRALPEPTC